MIQHYVSPYIVAGRLLDCALVLVGVVVVVVLVVLVLVVTLLSALCRVCVCQIVSYLGILFYWGVSIPD